MGAPDLAAQAAIAQRVIAPRFIGFLDILGDPIRVTTAPYGVTFADTGDADLDGHSFDAINPTFVSVSPVQHKEGGAATVTVTLSGLIGIDSDLLNQIGTKANWQGRVARLWCMMYNTPSSLEPVDLTTGDDALVTTEDGIELVDEETTASAFGRLGAVWPFYTGFMMVPKILGDATSQTITLEIESYLGFLAAATNRSYLSQSDYDADDRSADASIAVANGTNLTPTGGDGGAAAAREQVSSLNGLLAYAATRRS